MNIANVMERFALLCGIDKSEAVMDKYDLIVIGAGPGGYVAAIRGALQVQ